MLGLFIERCCFLFMNMHFLFPLAQSKPILLWIKPQTVVYYFTDSLDRHEATGDETEEGKWRMFQ